MANTPKLTRQDVWMIRNVRRPRGSQMVKRMAKYYGVSMPTVLAALHERGTYKDVKFTEADNELYGDYLEGHEAEISAQSVD